MKQELLPCPFCGGEAKNQSTGYGDYRVYCGKCECSTVRWSSSKEKAIAAWNRRTQHSPTTGQEEEF